MSIVMVHCGNPVCRSTFGVADPDGVWETDQELADFQGWRVDGALVACSDECLVLARVAELVTPGAITRARFAANSAVTAQYHVAGIWMCTAAKYGDDSYSVENALDHGLQAWSFELERDQLRRDADALAGAA